MIIEFYFYFFQMLDENASLIKTISEYQNVGKVAETVQYQWSLHRNLMYLASVADSNQNLQNLLPVKSSRLHKYESTIIAKNSSQE